MDSEQLNRAERAIRNSGAVVSNEAEQFIMLLLTSVEADPLPYWRDSPPKVDELVENLPGMITAVGKKTEGPISVFDVVRWVGTRMEMVCGPWRGPKRKGDPPGWLKFIDLANRGKDDDGFEQEMKEF